MLPTMTALPLPLSSPLSTPLPSANKPSTMHTSSLLSSFRTSFMASASTSNLAETTNPNVVLVRQKSVRPTRSSINMRLPASPHIASRPSSPARMSIDRKLVPSASISSSPTSPANLSPNLSSRGKYPSSLVTSYPSTVEIGIEDALINDPAASFTSILQPPAPPFAANQTPPLEPKPSAASIAKMAKRKSGTAAAGAHGSPKKSQTPAKAHTAASRFTLVNNKAISKSPDSATAMKSFFSHVSSDEEDDRPSSIRKKYFSEDKDEEEERGHHGRRALLHFGSYTDSKEKKSKHSTQTHEPPKKRSSTAFGGHLRRLWEKKDGHHSSNLSASGKNRPRSTTPPVAKDGLLPVPVPSALSNKVTSRPNSPSLGVRELMRSPSPFLASSPGSANHQPSPMTAGSTKGKKFTTKKEKESNRDSAKREKTYTISNPIPLPSVLDTVWDEPTTKGTSGDPHNSTPSSSLGHATIVNATPASLPSLEGPKRMPVDASSSAWPSPLITRKHDIESIDEEDSEPLPPNPINRRCHNRSLSCPDVPQSTVNGLPRAGKKHPVSSPPFGGEKPISKNVLPEGIATTQAITLKTLLDHDPEVLRSQRNAFQARLSLANKLSHLALSCETGKHNTSTLENDIHFLTSAIYHFNLSLATISKNHLLSLSSLHSDTNEGYASLQSFLPTSAVIASKLNDAQGRQEVLMAKQAAFTSHHSALATKVISVHRTIEKTKQGQRELGEGASERVKRMLRERLLGEVEAAEKRCRAELDVLEKAKRALGLDVGLGIHASPNISIEIETTSDKDEESMVDREAEVGIGERAGDAMVISSLESGSQKGSLGSNNEERKAGGISYDEDCNEEAGMAIAISGSPAMEEPREASLSSSSPIFSKAELDELEETPSFSFTSSALRLPLIRSSPEFQIDNVSLPVNEQKPAPTISFTGQNYLPSSASEHTTSPSSPSHPFSPKKSSMRGTFGEQFDSGTAQMLGFGEAEGLAQDQGDGSIHTVDEGNANDKNSSPGYIEQSSLHTLLNTSSSSTLDNSDNASSKDDSSAISRSSFVNSKRDERSASQSELREIPASQLGDSPGVEVKDKQKEHAVANSSWVRLEEKPRMLRKEADGRLGLAGTNPSVSLNLNTYTGPRPITERKGTFGPQSQGVVSMHDAFRPVPSPDFRSQQQQRSLSSEQWKDQRAYHHKYGSTEAAASSFASSVSVSEQDRYSGNHQYVSPHSQAQLQYYHSRAFPHYHRGHSSKSSYSSSISSFHTTSPHHQPSIPSTGSPPIARNLNRDVKEEVVRERAISPEGILIGSRYRDSSLETRGSLSGIQQPGLGEEFATGPVKVVEGIELVMI